MPSLGRRTWDSPSARVKGIGDSMSMADNSRKREFVTDAYPPKAKDSASDPLAELARLIGQSDPFAEQPGAPKLRADARPAPEWLSRPAPPVEQDEGDYGTPSRESYRAERYDPPEHQQPAAHGEEHDAAGTPHDYAAAQPSYRQPTHTLN